MHDHRETFCVPGHGLVLPSCSYVVDDLTLVFQALVLAGALVVVLLSLDTVRLGADPAGEYWFLLLCSVAGALTLAASRDLLTLVVSLEVVSLPAFALVALRRYDGRGSRGRAEAVPRLGGVHRGDAVRPQPRLRGDRRGATWTGSRPPSTSPATARPCCSSGVVLAIAGFAFKVAAVPFHFWAPDTYEGAPVPVAAYLSVVSKAAGFVGLALLLTRGFAPYADVWGPTMAVLAAATMTVGNLAALRQTPGRPAARLVVDRAARLHAGAARRRRRRPRRRGAARDGRLRAGLRA